MQTRCTPHGHVEPSFVVCVASRGTLARVTGCCRSRLALPSWRWGEIAGCFDHDANPGHAGTTVACVLLVRDRRGQAGEEPCEEPQNDVHQAPAGLVEYVGDGRG